MRKFWEELHPYTLSSANYLALVHRKQGQVEEAELLHQRVLSGREKTLGKEYPETFYSV